MCYSFFHLYPHWEVVVFKMCKKSLTVFYQKLESTSLFLEYEPVLVTRLANRVHHKWCCITSKDGVEMVIQLLAGPLSGCSSLEFSHWNVRKPMPYGEATCKCQLRSQPAASINSQTCEWGRFQMTLIPGLQVSQPKLWGTEMAVLAKPCPDYRFVRKIDIIIVFLNHWVLRVFFFY